MWMVEERFNELEDGTEGFTRGIKKEMTEFLKSPCQLSIYCLLVANPPFNLFPLRTDRILLSNALIK